MDIQQYHDHPALGSSGLKALRRSPAHYWAQFRDPARERKEPTPSMEFGTLVHCLILEASEFSARYVAIPEGLDRRTKEGKQLWSDIAATGKQPVKTDDVAAALSIARAATYHPAFAEIARHVGMVEHSFFCEWPAVAGVDVGCVTVKIRPDLYIPPCAEYPNGVIVDLKTAEDASPKAFAKAVANYEYWLQAAFYADVLQRINGTAEPPEFYWLPLEKEAPFAVAMYKASAELMQVGRVEYQRLIEIFAQCEKSNSWPAYPEEVQQLDLPSWAQREIMGDGEEVEAIGYIQE